MVMQLPSEVQLLACLSRFPFTEDDAGQAMRILEDDIDVERLLALCKFHRLAMHVTENLNGPYKVDLAKDMRFRLVKQALRARVISDLQLHTMKEVLFTFRQSGMDAFPIKGPATGTRIYGDPHRRILYDIDILVRPEDTLLAIQTLEQTGFQHVKTALQSGVTAKDVTRLHGWGSNIGFRKPTEKSVLIELHWRPARHRYEFPVDTGRIWDGRQSLQVDGLETFGMDPVQEVVFLASHGHKHEWKRLHWLCDIAALMRKQDTPWEDICNLAETCQLEQVLGCAVLLAHKVFGVAIPEPTEHLISKHKSLEARVHAIMRRRYVVVPKNDTAIQEACMEWRSTALLGSNTARFKTIVSHLQPGPDDWRWVRMPDWANAAYYPVRLARIAVETIRSI